MKMLLSLVISLNCAFPAFAANAPDDELMQALNNLKGKVEVIDKSRAKKLQDWGFKISGFTAFWAGAVALKGLQPVAVKPAAETAEAIAMAKQFNESVSRFSLSGGDARVLQILGYISTAGVIMLVTGWAAKKLSKKHKPQEPAYYAKDDRLNEFFSLTVEQQYEVAVQDPEFILFLIDLSHSYDVIAKGFKIDPPPLGVPAS